MTRRLLRRRSKAGLLAVLIAACGFGSLPAQAQMQGYEPMRSAMPAAERPAELRDALDLINHENQALRLRAEVWVRVAPCPNRKPREHCFVSTVSEGRLFVGPVWFDDPLSGFEVEKLWLLRKGEVWSTTDLRKTADHKIEFGNGPAWAGQQPVDVVVRLRGIKELLQVRYRTLYPIAALR